MFTANRSPPCTSSSSSSTPLSTNSPADTGFVVGSGRQPLLGSKNNLTNVGGKRSATGTTASTKRNWNEKKRAGMSFMIVIAFFAVFALIIIMEIVMIDEKSKAIGVAGRHGSGFGYGGGGGRLNGEAAPDYDDVKEEYSIEDALYQRNARYIQELRKKNAQNPGVAGGAGAGTNSNSNARLLRMPDGRYAVDVPPANGNSVAANAGEKSSGATKLTALPWGSLLPQSLELTLPAYPRSGTFGSRTAPTDAEWRIVNGTRYKFFVYSAFYDRRAGGRLVRVIGATKTRGPEKVWCRLWYAAADNGTGAGAVTSTSVVARVKVIRENWNLKYSACFVLCPLTATTATTTTEALPFAVSVVSKLRSPPSNVLRLHNGELEAAKRAEAAMSLGNATTTATDQTLMGGGGHAYRDAMAGQAGSGRANFIPPDSIAICIKPLHFDYDSALYLLEFLELNTLLGVSHFTMYNHTLGRRAACVLKHYQQHGGQMVTATDTAGVRISYRRPTVELLPWELRMRSQKEIRTEGLFAALNDCLYRNMYRYQYVALIDLDEFIMPRHNATLTELMRWLSLRINSRNTGAYSFQNAFFYLQFADDVLMYGDRDNGGGGGNDDPTAALRAAMITQRKTQRRTKLHPQKQRSKYICKPEAVVEAGNHFVWELIPGRGSLNVPVDAAILHHYRVCEFGGDDCIKTPSTIDRTAHRFGPQLVDRVQLQYDQLKAKCDLLDVPPVPTEPPPSAVANRRRQLQLQQQQVQRHAANLRTAAAAASASVVGPS